MAISEALFDYWKGRCKYLEDRVKMLEADRQKLADFVGLDKAVEIIAETKSEHTRGKL